MEGVSLGVPGILASAHRLNITGYDHPEQAHTSRSLPPAGSEQADYARDNVRHRRSIAQVQRSMMNSAEIAFQDVSYRVDGNSIITDLSCRLQVSRLAVLGTNGSGKSSFLRLIDGLEQASSGTISVMGIDPAKQAKDLHRRVGFVFTNPDTQIIMPTVREDVAFSLRGMKLSKEAGELRVEQCLRTFGLSEHAQTPAHSVSGGQKQMLALASVLLRGPELVIADEPTTMLDLPNAQLIGDYLIDHLARPVIIATHDLALASRCDYAVRFANGRLVEEGPAQEVIEHYRQDCAQRYRQFTAQSPEVFR